VSFQNDGGTGGFAVLDRPEANVAIVAGRGDPVPARRDGDRVDVARMSRQCFQLLTGREVPQLQRAIGAAGDGPHAVRVNADARDRVRVARERVRFVPGFVSTLPGLHSLVDAAGDKPFVLGANRDRVDCACMPFARRDAPAAPRLNGAVLPDRNNAVTGHRDAGDGAFMPAPRLRLAAAVQVPLTKAIDAAARQFLFIVDGHETLQVGLHGPELLAAHRIPENDVRFFGGARGVEAIQHGQNLLAIGRQGDRAEAVARRLALERLQLFAGRGVPDLDGVIVADRGEARAIARQAHADWARSVRHLAQLFAVLHVPDA